MKDLYGLIVAAAEQHGLDDPDNPNREVEDLREALHTALRRLSEADLYNVERELTDYGLLAGWTDVRS